MKTRNKSWIPVLIGGLTCVFAGLLIGFGALWKLRTNDVDSGAEGAAGKSSESQPLMLIVSGDTAGWIVPCGCTSNQSGGLPRRGTFVEDRRRIGDVILADVGGAPGGNSEYDRCKFEFILEGEMKMGLACHNLGGPELALGLDYLRTLAEARRLPFVSANVRNQSGQPIADAYRIVEIGGRHILLVGVVSKKFGTAECRIEDPASAIVSLVPTISEPYDSLVVLAYLPEEELRGLAAALPEADAVIGGPTTQSIAPMVQGARLVASATNKGKFLIELTASSKDDGAPWTGRVIEMGEQFKDDASQISVIREFHAELEKRDFSAVQTAFATALSRDVPKDFGIAGSKSCIDCHHNDCDKWQASRHAHAWETLKQSGSHVDAQCQRCHTTGFGQPGGFESARRSFARVAVGCESCHGPSREHVETASRRTPFIASDQCVRCHDPENSPKFNYTTYWERVHHGTRVALPTPDAARKGNSK